MMDGSLKEDGKSPADYDYNVDVTRKVVESAHACGVSVEGELGCLGSLETGMGEKEDGHGFDGVLSVVCFFYVISVIGQHCFEHLPKGHIIIYY